MEADQVLKKWEECLNNGDLANIVSLYSDNAVLWGTFSKIIRDSSELIEEYFEELFKKNLLRVHFGLIRPRTHNGTCLYSGMYKFSYMDRKLVILPARFTFVIGHDKEAGYRIMEHHSSLVPDSP